MEEKQLHESGLDIIENDDGSYAFEWNKNDPRWSWMNDLTDEQIRVIIEETIEITRNLEETFDDNQ